MVDREEDLRSRFAWLLAPARWIIPILLGWILPITFIAICLILMQWEKLSEDDRTLSSIAPATLAFERLYHVFTSRSAVIIYGILLAGILGSFLRHLLVRFRTDTPGAQQASSLTDLGAHLLVGASAAFIIAVLLPLALIRGGPDIPVSKMAETETILDQRLNVWALLILAGVVGYWSRSVLGDLAAMMSRLWAQVGRPFEEVQEQITKSVRIGVQDAMSPPKLVNYDGFIIVDVVTTDRNTVSVIVKPEGAPDDHLIRLKPGREYQLEVSFSDSPTPMSSALVKHLRIQGGIEDPIVPFRLHIDFGAVRIPIAERRISVPRSGASETAKFRFTPFPPSQPASQPAGDLTLDESGRTSSSPGILPPISVAVYQHGIFCEICLLQQEIESDIVQND
jgi:hypothetical protein